jgi:hypothetical protein
MGFKLDPREIGWAAYLMIWRRLRPRSDGARDRDVLQARLKARSSCQRSITRSIACPREGISPLVFAQPGRPASSGSVTLHDHFGSLGRLVMCCTRPITRPSKMATPSLPDALSGKVRRQVMLGSFIAVAFMARLPAGPQ